MQKLHPSLKAKDVLVIEDAPAGLQSGAAAGCRVLAVCTGPVAAADVAQAAAETEGAIVVRDLSRCVARRLLERDRASQRD